jgi:hypothetical protein
MVEPPSRDPAVKLNGIRKSACPGSGRAPIRFSSCTRYSAASCSPREPDMRPSSSLGGQLLDVRAGLRRRARRGLRRGQSGADDEGGEGEAE